MLAQLEMFSIPAFLGVAMTTFGVCSGTPPTPPTASAEAKSEPFFVGLKKVRLMYPPPKKKKHSEGR